MGSVYREACYGSDTEAATALCGAEYPRTADDGSGDLRVQTCSVVDGGHVLVSSLVPATSASAAVPVPVSFVGCDPMEHYTELGDLFSAGLVGIAFVLVLHMSFAPLWRNT